MKHDHLEVEPTGQSGGHCDCCGHESRTVWGNISVNGSMIACYFVHWTRKQPEHYPNLDFLIGNWGDDTKNDRVLVSWVYSASHNQFMIVDATARPAAKSDLCFASVDEGSGAPRHAVGSSCEGGVGRRLDEGKTHRGS